MLNERRFVCLMEFTINQRMLLKEFVDTVLKRGIGICYNCISNNKEIVSFLIFILVDIRENFG